MIKHAYSLFYLFMRKASDRFYSTQYLVDPPGLVSPPRFSRKHQSGRKPIKNEFMKNCDGTWSRPSLKIYRDVSYRNSSHAEDSTFLKKKDGGSVESVLAQMKSELQRLSYREKLIEIENLIRKSRDLSLEFGYFFVTATLLEYQPQQKIKLDIWIHPDSRALKPLHPIKRPTVEQCQFDFIASLKKTLRQFFPTIGLGLGETFPKLLVHVIQLKKRLMEKTRKKFIPFQLTKTHSIRPRPIQSVYNADYNVYNADYKKLITSLKAMPIPKIQISQRANEQIKQEEFQNKKYQKGTESTLMGESCIQDKLKMIVSTHNNCKMDRTYMGANISHESKSYQNIVNILKIPFLSQGYEEEFTRGRSQSIVMGDDEEFQNVQSPRVKKDKQIVFPFPEGLTAAEKKMIKHSIMKNSKLGKFMTTSVEIQSELNNLFGSEELQKGFYDAYSDAKKGKNSILSKVAEQFEQLLF